MHGRSAATSSSGRQTHTKYYWQDRAIPVAQSSPSTTRSRKYAHLVDMPTASLPFVIAAFLCLFSLSSSGAERVKPTSSKAATTSSACDLFQLRTCFATAFQLLKIDNNNKRVHKGEDKLRRIEKKQNNEPRFETITNKQQICANNRRFLNCFDERPDCSPIEAANMAATVYNDLRGRLLPMHLFLAHRGFAQQLCTHKCTNESRQFCQRLMGNDQQIKEHAIYLESLGQAKQVYLALEKNWRGQAEGACHKLDDTVGRLVFMRSEHCGDAGKCVCTDHQLAMAVRECKIDCEQTLRDIFNAAQMQIGRFTWDLSIISLAILSRIM